MPSVKHTKLRQMTGIVPDHATWKQIHLDVNTPMVRCPGTWYRTTVGHAEVAPAKPCCGKTDAEIIAVEMTEHRPDEPWFESTIG
jgi:hypothetical protein